MEQNIFSPRLTQLTKDSLSSLLRTMALGALTVIFGLLPIIFIPGVYTALGFGKVFVLGLGLFAGLILFSLAVLRSGVVRIFIPPALLFFWVFALVAVASAMLSGDVVDSMYGNVFEVHTAGFLILLALIMSAGLLFSTSKRMIVRFIVLLGTSAGLLLVYHTLRLVFGADFLSFGIFNSATISPIGSFNDLAIFIGLVVIGALTVMDQIRFSTWLRVAFGVTLLLSLVLLSVINFFTVWLVLGFFSLLLVLYLISRDTWLRAAGDSVEAVSRFSLCMVALVCLFSGAFIVSGDYLGSVVSKATSISYLEVRPSFESTLEVGKAVYGENALLGVGPNRFEDAWREYKNPIINQTLFWSTNFSGANGYIPTLFITTGIAGMVFWVLFFGAFLYLGYKLLFTTNEGMRGWYQLGLFSFVSALYLWGMAVVYVPGVTIIALASVMTGLTFAVYVASRPEAGLIVDVTKSRQYGLVLIGSVLVVIIASILTAISTSKQYLAGVVYADTVRAFQSGADFATTDAGLLKAEGLFAQDLFVAERAQLRLAELNALSTEEPTELTSQRYTALLSEGVGLSEQAIALDQKNPVNYLILSNFYSLLDPNMPEFSGVKEQVDMLFGRMRELDPLNPTYLLAQAQYKARIGDLASARTHVLDAIKIKSDYTDALFVLSQLDVQEGKVEDAIKVTSAMVGIEPNNPTRYFQLGVLLATTDDTNAAVQALERAVALDPAYANARYFLALSYLDQDRKDDALLQLRMVQETNQDNESLKNLIEQVESGTYVKPSSEFSVTVNSVPVVSTEEGGVTTTDVAPDTDLVSPVNATTPSEEDSDIVIEAAQ